MSERGWFQIPHVQDGLVPLERQVAGLKILRQNGHGRTILDLGSAEGMVSFWLVKNSLANVAHCVEQDAAKVKIGKRANEARKGRVKDRIKLIHADLNDLRFWERDGLLDFYDITLALAVLQKLKDPGPVFERMVARTGGWLAIRSPEPTLGGLDFKARLAKDFDLIEDGEGYPGYADSRGEAWLGIWRRKLTSQYELLHRRGYFSGKQTASFANEIGALCQKHKAETLLDFGCGKAEQYDVGRLHETWGVIPTCYDPAVPRFARLPDGPFDGVICVDVLEHLPQKQALKALDRIFERARKFVFISTCTGPASKRLPDGRNAHLTRMSEDWWHTRVKIANKRGIDAVLRFSEPSVNAKLEAHQR